VRRSPLRVALGGLLLSGVLSGCHVPGFAVHQPASKQATSAYHLWNATEFIALGVGALVWGLIFYCVIFYRRRRAATGIPSQRQYVVWLEVTYTIIPVLIVATLFGLTLNTQHTIDAISAHPDMHVDATAFQWGWSFHYPDGNVTTASEGDVPADLYLPMGKTVEFTLSATDVVHGFFVPAFLFQRNAVPGSPTRFDITPTRIGTYDGKCATFCGLYHDDMLFTVHVVSPSDFDAWLAQHQPAAAQ
jgi:cytochrome c oxidase subunit 2